LAELPDIVVATPSKALAHLEAQVSRNSDQDTKNNRYATLLTGDIIEYGIEDIIGESSHR
jgi:hypothetical protein